MKKIIKYLFKHRNYSSMVLENKEAGEDLFTLGQFKALDAIIQEMSDEGIITNEHHDKYRNVLPDI